MKFTGLSLYYYICISTKKLYCNASREIHYKTYIFLKQYITFLKNKQVQKKLHFTMHVGRILHSKNNMSHVLGAKHRIPGLKDRHDKAGNDLSVRADHQTLSCVCKTVTQLRMHR